MAKTSKKTAKKSKTAKTTAKRAPRFSPTAKITVLAKENPRRAGSGQAARFDVLRKYSGKTVEAYLAAKGAHVTCLRFAVANGEARVS
jgi:hypothetical protein